MGVDAKTFQELNDRVDLLKYASQTIELEQRGSDWWGRCPLHTDNTPSFSITPSKNYYYCFSCGCHGGIVKFLMDFEHLTYPQAVNKACETCGNGFKRFLQIESILIHVRYETYDGEEASS